MLFVCLGELQVTVKKTKEMSVSQNASMAKL
jgi:hypothetical protein